MVPLQALLALWEICAFSPESGAAPARVVSFLQVWDSWVAPARRASFLNVPVARVLRVKTVSFYAVSQPVRYLYARQEPVAPPVLYLFALVCAARYPVVQPVAILF